jgi:hypothetical protein
MNIILLFTLLCYAAIGAVFLYYLVIEDMNEVDKKKNSIIVKDSSDVTIIMSDEELPKPK